jgi:hypothetical protein
MDECKLKCMRYNHDVDDVHVDDEKQIVEQQQNVFGIKNSL